MILNPIFTDHMVFAANKPIRVYGEGEGMVCVEFANQSAEVCAENGKWLAQLKPMERGGAYELKVRSLRPNGEEIILRDIHVGEVYLCAGQSNMQVQLHETAFEPECYTDESRLRFFSTKRVEKEPFSPEDGWMCSTKDTAAKRSAIGYIMGMERVRKSGAATGIICCYQGGSVIESWMPEGIYDEMGIALQGADKYADPCRREWWNADGALYEFALKQVLPFSVSGVVWYQGESNGREAEGRLYEAQLRTLIERWRSDFRDEALPFVIVQIHDFWRPASKMGWVMVQQAQKNVAESMKNVRMAVSRDVCETDLIHPTKKEELAIRIAQAWEELRRENKT